MTGGTITKENLEEIYPLLPLQEGMLFHQLYEDDSSTFFQQYAFRISGSVDVRLLEESWNALMARHQLLRSAIVQQGGSPPVQVVLKQRSIEFGFEDLAFMGEVGQQEVLQRFKQDDRARGFDLRNDPLIRIKLFRLGEQLFEMVWSHPHILLDGWSGAVLHREFHEIYTALRSRRTPKLPPVPRYGRYLDWWESRDRSASRDWWRSYLDGYDTPAGIGSEGSDQAGYDLREWTFSLDTPTCKALTEFAGGHGVTLTTVFSGIWGLLLASYNNVTDVVFGTVVSGRPAEVDGIESMVGLFINTIPVRVSLDAGQSFGDLLARLHAESGRRSEHAEHPLAEIQSDSQLKRNLLDHLLVFENYPTSDVDSQDADDAGLKVISSTAFEQANYDFGILVLPGESITIKFSYNGNRFEADRMQQIESHWRTLISDLLGKQNPSVGDLETIPAEEKAILSSFKAPTRSFPETATLAQLWEAQVEKTPTRDALRFESRRLSYHELNEKANRLAHYLREHHRIGPEDAVGVFLPRGVDLIVSLLGILKAGGVYVPIDPAYPDQRIRFIVDDSECQVVLTDSTLTTRLDEITSVQHVEPDGVEGSMAHNPQPVGGAADAAYLIYTSGSTGTPKGVLVPHRGFVNMILEQITAFQITSQDRVLQFASISFDASLSEVFMALLSGSSLVMADTDRLLDPAQLQAIMTEEEVTVVTLPPSLLAALDQAPFPGLRVLITAGEAARPGDANHYARSLSYFNAYGPTEYSVCATLTKVESQDTPPQSVSIGRPISNTEIRLLNRFGQLSPLGAPGEMHISGAGLARGYHKRPDLTAERFRPGPSGSGERWYCTGDLARYLPDGQLEFLGRVDNQLKIRGHRIEPGEIEQALLHHPDINDAAVLSKRFDNGSLALVAYTCGPQAISLAELKAYLTPLLPDYMVPTFHVALERFPLTVNGKLDRKALPEPDDSNMPTATEYVAPRDEHETALCTIWQEVLGRERIGVFDDFFELGGDSLHAVRLMSRIIKQFGFPIPIKALFNRPTIGELAPLCRDSDACDSLSTLADAEPDFEAESRLDPAIRPTAPFQPTRNESDAILVTGATGFLGPYLIQELLTRTRASIFCLVRARDVENGHERLDAAFATYGLDVGTHRSRLIPVIGDLTRPKLGLSDTQFEELATSVDVIYHNGAIVNFISPYSHLKAANVAGTCEVLKLACQTKTKPCHFVSTLSVFPASDRTTAILESEIPDSRGLHNGYAQSKWVAEQLVRQAHERGLPGFIFRPGRITGDSRTGAFNGADYFYSMIKGSIQIGMAPDSGNDLEDLTPVDYVSKAIVRLAMQEHGRTRQFHLLSPQPIRLFDLMKFFTSRGHSLRKVAFEQWRDELLRHKENDIENALHPFLPLYEDFDTESEQPAPPSFDSRDARTALAECGLECPPADEALLSVYYQRLLETGYLNEPASVG